MSDRQIQTVVSPDKRDVNINANTRDNKHDSGSNILPLEMKQNLPQHDKNTNPETQRLVTPEKIKVQ